MQADLNLSISTDTCTPPLVRMIECVVCCRKVVKKKKHQKTCSTLCKKSLHIARRRVSRLRDRSVGDELPTVLCIICKTGFTQRQQNYVCCGKAACKRQRGHQTGRRWRLENQGI